MSRDVPIAMGQRFNRWTVLSETPKVGTHQRYLCRCDCGTEKVNDAYSVSSGRSKSCGCLKSELATNHIRHGHARSGDKSKIYLAWEQMLARCLQPSNKGYKNYGGRGISVCGRWLKFEYFLADMGNPPRGLTLERDDVNGNYEPHNCRWASRQVQNNNKRSNIIVVDAAETLTLAEFARLHGLRYDATRWALKKGIRNFAGHIITVTYPEKVR